MTCHRLLLLADMNVPLHVWDRELGLRFRNLFRSCWDRVPADVRQAVLFFWGSKGDGVLPRAEFSDVWGDSHCSCGQVRYSGLEMRFSESAFRALLGPGRTQVNTVEAAAFVIAHELAHVYQKALGFRPGGINEADNEAEADEFATSWGFDDSLFRAIQLVAQEHGDDFEYACKTINSLGGESS